jgi:hypothetical protein
MNHEVHISAIDIHCAISLFDFIPAIVTPIEG